MPEDDDDKPEKDKKDKKPWECGFDITDEANWPRLKKLLISNDEAAIKDITRYYSFMVREADSHAVHQLHMRVHDNHPLLKQAYQDCIQTILEQY
jgi:hypothetical protein